MLTAISVRRPASGCTQRAVRRARARRHPRRGRRLSCHRERIRSLSSACRARTWISRTSSAASPRRSRNCPCAASSQRGLRSTRSTSRRYRTVLVVRAAAHTELIPKADLVITHAGHGTLIKAIAAGVPTLCIPLGRDQPDNAARAATPRRGCRAVTAFECRHHRQSRPSDAERTVVPSRSRRVSARRSARRSHRVLCSRSWSACRRRTLLPDLLPPSRTRPTASSRIPERADLLARPTNRPMSEPLDRPCGPRGGLFGSSSGF